MRKQFHKCGIPVRNRESKCSKPLINKNYSDFPNYDQLYSKFLSSLSQEEREKFLEFGLKKAAELPKPPTLSQKWVERNWQELAAEFEKSNPMTTKTDWSLQYYAALIQSSD